MLLPETAEQQLGPITAKSVLPDADAETLPPKGGEPEMACCMFNPGLNFVYLDNSQRLLLSYTVMTPPSGVGFQIRQKVYANGVLVPTQNIPLSGTCQTKDGFAYVDYSYLGECPDRVRIDAELWFYDGGWQSCSSRTYQFTDGYVYNLTHEPPCATPSDPDLGTGFN